MQTFKIRFVCLTVCLIVCLNGVHLQDGMTPLMFAAKQGGLEVVNALVKGRHADLNIEENVCSSYVTISPS